MAIRVHILARQLLAVICSLLLTSATLTSAASELPQQQASAPAEEAPKIPNDQLDSLVSPIALYPDPLLAQVLVASTYPLEIMQLQQWLNKNKDLKDKALTEAVEKQNWDPSIQAMAVLPDVVKRLSDDIQWATDLGNAFLAQQSDVMDAVQRMRTRAKDKGNLKSSDQMLVETKTIEGKTVVVIEQSNPQVLYVPSYDPMVVYGPPIYPYPPIYYPPAGYYAAGMALSFGVGLAIGAAWGGGGWGWNSGWGGNNNININNNNNFVRNSNIQGGRNNVGNRPAGGNNWKHNPQHRGGTPYSNRATANQFGGTARGDSMANRQTNARQNQSQLGSRQQPGASNRAAGGANNLGANRGGSAGGGAGNLGSNRSGGGGGDRIGNRSVSPSANTGSRGGGFGGGSTGTSGSGARSSSSRGASSMGGARSSGSRGGGSRGGGGRRR